MNFPIGDPRLNDEIQEEVLFGKEKFTIESIPVGPSGLYYTINSEGRFVKWKGKGIKPSPKGLEPPSSPHVTDILSHEYKEQLQKALDEGKVESWEEIKAKDGEKPKHYIAGSLVEDMGKTYLIGVAVDVELHSRAESEVRSRDILLSAALESTVDGVLVVDEKGMVSTSNRRFIEMWNIPPSLVAERDFGKVVEMIAPQLESPERFMDSTRQLEGHPAERSREAIRCKDGRTIERSTAPLFLGPGKNDGRICFFRDITDKIVAEETRERFNEILEITPDFVGIADAKGRGLYINEGGRRMLGWGLDVKISGRQIIEAHPEWAQKQLEQVSIPAAMKKGIWIGESSVVGPGGEDIPVSQILHVHRDLDGTPINISTIMRDISDQKDLERKLIDALRGTIRATAKMLEMRDPFTASHHINVARLSYEITLEMGKPESEADFIYIAASVHDVGKIYVPAEILSKPTSLTFNEFGIMKTHAQKGYEIFKDIEFPWPIAEVILQHHERMNGSGYPNEIKGNDILIEARILAVADTLEAMVSHRPYRQALGMDVALEEIMKNRGELYDPDVVDAAVRVIQKKGFVF